MPIPKLFIASSDEARPIVSALMRALGEEKIECIPWFKCFEPGENVLNTLIAKSKECDYIAVILTEDDELNKKGERRIVPRDNCIFELGLFLGALHGDPKRCFMVTSLDQDRALPSDLAGRTYVEISKDSFDLSQCIKNAANKIMDQVSRYGPLERGHDFPFLTPRQLMDREQPRSPDGQGGNLVIEQGLTIVVNSVQPVETQDYDIANIVRANMFAGVKYEYFFEGGRNTDFIANLIQTLAISGIPNQTMPNPHGRKEITEKYQEHVKANLLLLQQNLSIHFRQRPPLQFCVHNANRDADAICYLSYKGSGFVEWLFSRDAVDVATELTNSCLTRERHKYIFHSTRDFPLNKHKKFMFDLRTMIMQRFSQTIHDDLKAICFETKL